LRVCAAFTRHDQTMRRIRLEGGIDGFASERHLALDNKGPWPFIVCASFNAQNKPS
jgi:hypothetical protein